MPRHLPSRAATALSLSAGLLAGAGCTVNVNTTTAEARETRTFTVAGAPRVTLDTFDGAIEIHSWDRREIEVEIEKRGQDEAVLQEIVVEASQDGDAVTVRVRGPERTRTEGVTVGISQSPSARLRVALPRDSQLDVHSGDGSLRVEDVAGAVVLRTEEGSIQGLRLTGDVDARTGDGSIRLEKAGGAVAVETGDGSVTVDGAVRRLRAKSGDGAVRITLDEGAPIAEDWDVSTGDGSITLRLPRTVDAVIAASTSDGSIRSSHPMVAIPEEPGRRRDVTVTAGAGGSTIRLKTGDGAIRIE